MKLKIQNTKEDVVIVKLHETPSGRIQLLFNNRTIFGIYKDGSDPIYYESDLERLKNETKN